MDRVAATLQRDGCKPGDTIAICALASNAYVVLFMGALRAGLAVAPLAPSSTPAQIAGMTADAGARHLSSMPPMRRPCRRALTGERAAHPPRRFERRPAAVAVAGAGGQRAPAGAHRPAVAVQHHLFVGHHRHAQGHRAAARDALGARSGAPRPAATAPDGVTLIATPLYSNTTLVVVIPTLARGGALVLMPKFDCALYLALAEQHRATHTMLVPVQYQRLMAWPDFDRHDLSSFQFKACTSAPFRAELKAEVLRRWPGGLTEYYGMTEGGGSCILYCHLFPQQAAHRGPAGRRPRHPPDRRRRARAAAAAPT